MAITNIGGATVYREGMTFKVSAYFTSDGVLASEALGFIWAKTVAEATFESLTSMLRQETINVRASFVHTMAINIAPPLEYGQVYYVRGFYINPNTGNPIYGGPVTFKTPTLPVPSVTSLAYIGGKIELNGYVGNPDYGSAEMGFVWSTTNQNPTVADTKKTVAYYDNSTPIQANIYNPTKGTTYYVRAYAKSSLITEYSPVRSVTVPATLIPARLKDGEFRLMGEIEERLPAVTNGLVAHYPFDDSELPTDLIVAELNSKIISSTEDLYLPANAPVFSDEMGMTLSGSLKEYARTHAGSPILKNNDGLDIEIDIHPASYKSAAIISQYSGYSHASRRHFTLRLQTNGKIQVIVGSWRKERILSSSPTEPNPTGWELATTSTSIVPLSKWTKVRFTYDQKRLNLYINDQLEAWSNALPNVEINGHMYSQSSFDDPHSSFLTSGFFLGSDGAMRNAGDTRVNDPENDPQAMVPGWTGVENFHGSLKNLRISKLAPLSMNESAKKGLTERGIAVEEATTNTWTGAFGVYNNLGQPASLTKLEETYLGEPVYRLSFRATTEASLASMRTNLWSHGVVGGNQQWVENTAYVSSIYWRPVNKMDTVFGGTASNIGGWASGKTDYLPDGWRRYYRHRTGVGVATRADQVHHSFYCPSLKMDETIYIDVCCPQTESGKTYPTSFVKQARSENGNVTIPTHIDSKTEPFSVNFWIAVNKDGGTGSQTNKAIHLNNFGYLWRYMPAGSDTRKFVWDYIITTTTRVYQDMVSPTPFIENEYEMITITWDLSNTRVYRNGSNLVTKNPNADCTLGVINEIKILNLNAFIKDFSIYNKALSANEIQNLLTQKPFSITEKGDLKTTSLIEGSIIQPKDIIHIPLDFNGESVLGDVKPVLESNTVYEDGAVWLGAASRNLNSMNEAYGSRVSSGGWGGFTATGSYVEMFNPIGAPKVARTAVRYSGTGGGGTGFGNIGDLTVSPSTTYTASYYIKTTNEAAFHANFIYLRQYNASGTQLSEVGHYSSARREYVGDGWYRIWATFTTSADTTRIKLEHYTYLAADYEHYFCGGQLEQGGIVTPFMNGARGFSRLNYRGTDLTTNNWQEFTFSYWVKYSLNTDWRLSGAWSRFYFGPNGSNILRFSWVGFSGAGDTTSEQNGVSGGTVSIGRWTMLTCSVKNNEFIDLYIDGVRTANWQSQFQLNNTSMDLALNDMNHGNVNYPQNAWMKDVVIANRAMTPEEIAAMYQTQMQAKGDSLQVKNLIRENSI